MYDHLACFILVRGCAELLFIVWWNLAQGSFNSTVAPMRLPGHQKPHIHHSSQWLWHHLVLSQMLFWDTRKLCHPSVPSWWLRTCISVLADCIKRGYLHNYTARSVAELLLGRLPDCKPSLHQSGNQHISTGSSAQAVPGHIRQQQTGGGSRSTAGRESAQLLGVAECAATIAP